MLHRYIVAYDITDDRIRNRVFTTMKGFGEHVQYSVFRCDLSEVQKGEMMILLTGIINHALDQVLVVDLGQAGGRAARAIEAIGLPYTPPRREAIVL